MKIGYIIQPAGAGDIFYCLKIAIKLIEDKKVDKVIWPVIDHYSFIKDYIKINNIEFPSINEPELSFLKKYYYSSQPLKVHYLDNDQTQLIIPLQTADKVFPNSLIPHSKYNLVNLDYTDWDNYFNFERNYDNEKNLFEKLNIQKNEEFVIISNNYGSPSDENNIRSTAFYDIPYNGKKRTVKLNFIEGVSLFDWCGVLEAASEIHMIESCWIYIMEKLKVNANILKLYSRRGHHKQTEHIYKNIKWQLM